MTPPARTVVLHLGDGRGDGVASRQVGGNLSAVVAVGAELWLAADEGTSVERLTATNNGAFAQHRAFDLGDVLDLPTDGRDEVDLEGVDHDGRFLWVTGSHGRARKQPDPTAKDSRKQLRRLAQVRAAGNRHLLARIPLVPGDDGHEPARKASRAEGTRSRPTAARLPADEDGGVLVRALRHDAHLAPFLSLPDKDNGFNVEGLAARNGRVVLGLRGPVLRGWAVLLEVAPEDDGAGRLRLAPMGPKGRRYRKHVLDLRGLGTRDLCWDGADLLILAGPTLPLEAPSAVFRWRGACPGEGDTLVGRTELERVLELPHGTGEREGTDHPEGLALLDPNGPGRALLVVYDAPSEARRVGDVAVQADIFPLPPRG